LNHCSVDRGGFSSVDPLLSRLRGFSSVEPLLSRSRGVQ